MAKKKIMAVVKIQIEAGKASPAPPVGTALGPHGIAIMDFVKAYNAQTEANAGSGRISYNSPIARGLIGKKVDDEIEVTVPSGDKFYLVSKIEFI